MRALERLQREGIRRLGTPRTGFRYVRPDGRPVPRADTERIRALRLPPAWTDVHVSPAPGAKLQAVGRDAAGRWQYRYHREFMKRQASAKYRRLLRFAEALPRIRAAVDRDMRRRGLVRARVLAAMVLVLERCFMRPGSEAYARENRSYGLATIRPRHVKIEGDRLVFDYRGKSGKRQVRELGDARVVRLVKELLAVPGRDVFKFVEDGEIVDVRRRHLNAYIRAAAGAPFTAKDFRTWAGTLLCATALAGARGEMVPGRTSSRSVATAAVKQVAQRLGNTPAVARSSYISPAVLDGFARGKVLRCALADAEVIEAPPGALHETERALVAFLREASPRAAPPLRALEGGGRPAPGPRRATRPTGTTAKPLRRAARGAERGEG
ncbi:DNA topoisomerase IB [Anaeromyxobacter oryzae]|uniref:DNA topoisomerase n=1 Tax=Anaeromyxobacter oryzae TaxID=2918170 RepID=A0ABN6MPX7_9BACT|nr:DNA topoisomerase IB [Anaeromyxobacter oryzae]BDG01987.1 DNA topoisomerase [Anaeromyxobacter oryzae]